MDTIFEFFQNNKNTDLSDKKVEIGNIQNIRSQFSNDLPILFSQVIEVLANCDTKGLVYDSIGDTYYVIHIDPFFEISIGDSGCETIYCHFEKIESADRAFAFYQMV